MLRAMRTVDVRRSSMQRAGPLASSVAGRRRLRETLEGHAFLLPTIFGLALFWLGPVVASVLISFTDWGNGQRVSWLGLANYRALYTSPLFWKVFANTWYYTLVSVPAGMLLSLGLALLQSIDRSLQEAAAMDGANGWQRFRNVTWPGLTPTTLFVLVIMLIGSFQVFEQTYIMTEGGPAYATLTMSYYIYLDAFQYFHMGQAAALAYVLFAVVCIVTALQFGVQRRWVFYQ